MEKKEYTSEGIYARETSLNKKTNAWEKRETYRLW